MPMRALTGLQAASASFTAATICFSTVGEVGRIDAAFEGTGTPQTERVRSFMIVRAGNENVVEARQLFSDAFDVRMKEANEIDGDKGDFFLAVFENDRASLERIVNSGRLAIVAEAGQVHRFLLHARRDVRFGETGLQTVACGRDWWSIRGK